MNVNPMSPRPAPRPCEEDAPDDLVGAAREVAAGVDDDDGDQAAVPEAASGASGPARDRGRRRRRPRRAGRGTPSRAGTRSQSGEGAGVRPDRRLADAQADRDAPRRTRDRAEDEHEADPAEPAGAERADRRTEQQPAHLGRAVQPERLAPALRRRRVGQVAAGGRVVDRRAERRSRRAAATNGDGAREHQRQDPEDAGRPAAR